MVRWRGGNGAVRGAAFHEYFGQDFFGQEFFEAPSARVETTTICMRLLALKLSRSRSSQKRPKRAPFKELSFCVAQNGAIWKKIVGQAVELPN
jgi:hypothetical protein